MKKFLAIVLALVVVSSLCASAFAGTSSASASQTSSTSTAALPAAEKSTVIMKEFGDEALSEEQAAAFDAAKEALAEAAPEGYVAQYTFFASEAAGKYPVNVELAVDNAEAVIVMIFVDGKWQEVECKLVDGKLTFALPCEAPVAVFTK